MHTRQRTVAVAIAVAVAVASAVTLGSRLTGDEPRPVAAPSSVPSPACANPSNAVNGYAITGDILAAVLRPISLCPPTLGTPILAQGAEKQRVSWLTGTAARAVVAESGTGADQLSLVTSDGLVPVPDLGRQAGHGPALAPDGRLAWIEQGQDASGRHGFGVRLFDPATRQRTTVQQLTAPPIALTWGPGGRLALIASQGTPDAHLLVVDPASGAARRLADLPAAAVGLLWTPAGDFIVTTTSAGQPAGGALVLDGDGRQRGRVPSQWRPLGLTPDGALIGVTPAGQIARLAAPGYDKPVVYGTLPAGEQVWQIAL